MNVFAQTAGNVVHDTNVTDSLLAGERASYEWNGTSWDYVGGTPLGALTYTARCTTALGTAKAVSIPGFTLKDGTTVEVLFTNGHYVAVSSDPMTLNVNSLGAKPIYAVKDGSPVVMPNHSCTRSESGDSTAHYWVIQANTFLKLMYDSLLDSNNGGWLVLGNPVVLSSSSANESYTVYADGSSPYKLSDAESFTLTTTNTQVAYDGFITFTCNIGSHLEIYLNDENVAAIDYGGGSTSNRRNSTTIPVNAGDNVKVGTASGTAVARWYKERY